MPQSPAGVSQRDQVTWKTKNVIKHDTFMPRTVSPAYGIQQVQARLTMVAVIQGSDKTLQNCVL